MQALLKLDEKNAITRGLPIRFSRSRRLFGRPAIICSMDCGGRTPLGGEGAPLMKNGAISGADSEKQVHSILPPSRRPHPAPTPLVTIQMATDSD
ncbi:unnamed protein product, partial [Iphiclides podalirius]